MNTVGADADVFHRATRRFGWILAGVWTLLVVAVFSFLWKQDHETVHTLALTSANLALAKDLTYRKWVAQHGGVYVPVTEKTPPSPYLSHIPERDITTPSGRRLTLLNPAYMTRQVNELGKGLHGLAAHLTSLRPLRPENVPDGWEAAALRSFEEGEAEASAEVLMDGRPHMRIMIPFVVEESCLKCHAGQGYQVGDIRGGLSVAAPLAPYVESGGARLAGRSLGLGLLYLMGLVGILLAWRRLLAVRRVADAHRQRAAKELSESEARHRALFESSRDAIMTLAPPLWRFTSGNAAALAMFGANDIDEFTACDPWELSPAHQPDGRLSAEKAIEGIEQAMSQGSCSFEWTHRRIGGESFPAHVLLTRVEMGGERFLQATVRDLTEVRKLERENREAETRIQHLQRLESIGSLASGVAHEINNPLNVIMNYGQLVLDDEETSAATREYAAHILDEGERVATIVRSLMSFSNQGQQTLAPVRAAAIVADVLSLVRAAFLKDGILIETRVPQDAPAVHGRGQQLQQVLMNLLANARDALNERYPGSSDDKRITIEVSHIEVGGVPWARFLVEDRGGGISPNVTPRIFDPFFSTRPKHRHAGIGLAIGHAIVKDHGGRLWFETKPGIGTRFYLDLKVDMSG
jgi:PAS domain S-box-containing protein